MVTSLDEAWVQTPPGKRPSAFTRAVVCALFKPWVIPEGLLLVKQRRPEGDGPRTRPSWPRPPLARRSDARPVHDERRGPAGSRLPGRASTRLSSELPDEPTVVSRLNVTLASLTLAMLNVLAIGVARSSRVVRLTPDRYEPSLGLQYLALPPRPCPGSWHLLAAHDAPERDADRGSDPAGCGSDRGLDVAGRMPRCVNRFDKALGVLLVPKRIAEASALIADDCETGSFQTSMETPEMHAVWIRWPQLAEGCEQAHVADPVAGAQRERPW